MAGAAEHKYSYDDGDIVFVPSDVLLTQVEATPYRVHSFHLQRATAHFDKDLQAFREGDGKPITLEDVKRTDFENLLWFFYESAYNW
ncbi:hypothetical protein K525DRAFT_206389 [Schizophyllum commune Loenen D]|nr:hypothetical protein K525DRAFT_206389 [Schizophyllum commune Loenen D]